MQDERTAPRTSRRTRAEFRVEPENGLIWKLLLEDEKFATVRPLGAPNQRRISLVQWRGWERWHGA